MAVETEVGDMEQAHVFLGEEHEHAEHRAWAVIALCVAMMVLEIGGGLAFGSIALVADGLHMSTHAGALLLAALAYMVARRHAHDKRFSFGTGKLGDLAGFTSAIVLALVSALIGYEAIGRLLHPTTIAFAEALPIATLGLFVNLASVWLLRGHHEHDHNHGADRHDEPPLAIDGAQSPNASHATSRDNNMRAAVIHVLADAAVSALVIVGLGLAFAFGWVWMDPLAGLIGACVIAAWSFGLIRDTGSVLLDMNPDSGLTERVKTIIEADGDRLADLHVWRLGPGHLGAILSVRTRQSRDADFYRAKLARFRSLSHTTVEVIAL